MISILIASREIPHLSQGFDALGSIFDATYFSEIGVQGNNMGFEFETDKIESAATPALATTLDRAVLPSITPFRLSPVVPIQDSFETASLPRLNPARQVKCTEALELLREKVMLSPHDIARLLELSHKFAADQEIGCDLERQIFIDSSQQVSRAAERLRELTIEKRFVPGPLVDSMGLVQAGMTTNLGAIVSCLRRLGIAAVGVIAPKDWEARSFVWRLYYQD